MTSTSKNGDGSPNAALNAARADAHELLRRGRRARAKRIGLFMAVGVALPTFLAAIYFGFIASDQFESAALISVRSAPSAADRTKPAQGITKVSDQDTQLVRKYALSRAAMKRLDDEHGWIAHYQDEHADVFSRLSADAPVEEAFDFYRSKVSMDYDSASGSLALSVTAFAPEEAARFAGALIQYSEEMLQSLMSGADPAQRRLSSRNGVQSPDEPGTAVAAAALAQHGGDSAPTTPASGDHRAAITDAVLVEQLPPLANPAPRLAIVAAPSLAESATKPRRIASVLTVLALSATLLGIASLLIAALREHAKI